MFTNEELRNLGVYLLTVHVQDGEVTRAAAVVQERVWVSQGITSWT